MARRWSIPRSAATTPPTAAWPRAARARSRSPGANTYTGPTTISAGTLGGGSYAGAIADAGGLVYNSSAAQTLSGAISGVGTLTQAGPGTLNLSTTNSFSGGLSVQAGTVTEFNNGFALSSGTVNISSGAVVVLESDNGTITQAPGTFTGTGTLRKTGATLFAFGNNGNVNISLSAGGLIDVQAGTLQGSASSQGLYTNNQPGLNIAAGATFNGSEGTVIVDALTGAGTLEGGYGGTHTTTVGIANGSGTFSGVIQDLSTGGNALLALTKTGTGTQTLTGANTYTGPTSVNGGTLLVNGTSSGTGLVTVQNSGSVLGGTGTIAAAVSVTTGTLNPGNNAGANGSAANVGKLTVGALTLSSTATAIFDLNGGTTYDQLVANGNVALGGSTLTLNVLSSTTAYTVGQVLDLFHNNSGALSGTFSNFTNNGLYSYGGDTFRANYTGTDFELTVTAVPEPATWLGGALLLGATGWSLRRRLAGVHRVG